MIKHILNRIWNERRTNLWITLELLLISVCLWFLVDYLYVKIYTYNQPLGFDITNTYQVKFNQHKPVSYLYKEETEAEAINNYRLILERIKQDPTVEAICLTNNLFHYKNEMSTMYISSTQNDTLANEYARFYKVTPDYFNVFRVKDQSNKSVQDYSDILTSGGVIVTSTTEAYLFGDNSIIGKKLYAENSEMVVAGVTQSQRPSEFSLPILAVYQLLPEQNIERLYKSRASIFVRIKSAADNDSFARQFTLRMRDNLSLGNTYLYDLVPMQRYRKSYIKNDVDELQLSIVVALFLLINIFLGVLGTFWFRTRHRKVELGLRVALGSNKVQLRMLLIGEGIILLTLVFIPTIIICFNLGYAELIDVYLMPLSALRFGIGLGITYLLIAFMIILGIFFPAQQAIAVSPTEALHD